MHELSGLVTAPFFLSHYKMRINGMTFICEIFAFDPAAVSNSCPFAYQRGAAEEIGLKREPVNAARFL